MANLISFFDNNPLALAGSVLMLIIIFTIIGALLFGKDKQDKVQTKD